MLKCYADSRYSGKPMTIGNVNITAKVADCYERRDALRGRADLYVGDYGHPGVDKFDRPAIHVVAIAGGKVVAGARVLGPTPIPLELQELVDLQNVVRTSRIFQIGSLWVLPSYRRIREPSEMPSMLLMKKIIYLAQCMDVAGIVLRTAGVQRERYYQAIGFKKLPGAEFCDPVWGSVGVMYLDVSASRLRPEPRKCDASWEARSQAAYGMREPQP